MKTRSTFRRRKNGPDNSAYFGYRAARDPRNEPFFGTQRAFFDSCSANHEHNRTRPLGTKHQPGETGRQLAARLRAEVSVADAPAKPKRVRAKKAAA